MLNREKVVKINNKYQIEKKSWKFFFKILLCHKLTFQNGVGRSSSGFILWQYKETGSIERKARSGKVKGSKDRY